MEVQLTENELNVILNALGRYAMHLLDSQKFEASKKSLTISNKIMDFKREEKRLNAASNQPCIFTLNFKPLNPSKDEQN